MPVANAMRAVLDEAVATGLGGADWSELVALAERHADIGLHWSTESDTPA
jgi:hypothetical protein